MIRPITLLLCASLAAAPGAQHKGTALLATHTQSLSGTDFQTQSDCTRLVFAELDLWMQAANSFRRKDKDAILEYASTIPRWQAVLGDLQHDNLRVVTLLWLERRLDERPDPAICESTPQFWAWRNWITTAIRDLSAKVDDEHRHFLIARKANQEGGPILSALPTTNPVAAQGETKGIAYLQSLWAKQKAEDQAKAEAEADAADPAASLKRSVARGQADYLNQLKTALGLSQ